MKVIFTKDVPSVAKSGQLKDVADGYARNYLIPQNMAVVATERTLKSMAAQMESSLKREVQEEADNKKLAEHINGREIFIEAKSGGNERLYGSVTNTDIAEALEEATGLAIDKRKVKVPQAIHQLGTYKIEIKLAKDVVPVIKVTVTEKPSEE